MNYKIEKQKLQNTDFTRIIACSDKVNKILQETYVITLLICEHASAPN